MTTSELFSQNRLSVFEQGSVDLVDVIDFVGHEIGDDQIESVVG
jgi:hypothetical protein